MAKRDPLKLRSTRRQPSGTATHSSATFRHAGEPEGCTDSEAEEEAAEAVRQASGDGHVRPRGRACVAGGARTKKQKGGEETLAFLVWG